jgi:hypothetical protein
MKTVAASRVFAVRPRSEIYRSRGCRSLGEDMTLNQSRRRKVIDIRSGIGEESGRTEQGDGA